MCRLLGYLGPPVTLQALLYDPPHSLHAQSWAPQQQRSGVVNADGAGVGWYDLARQPEPARYRTARPMWADQSLASLAGVVASGAVLAAVRSATPPSPAEETSTPPFVDGSWLFAHNGSVTGFRTGVAARLRRALSEEREARILGTSDSEVLFALFLERLDDGMPPDEALAAVVDTVEALGEGGFLTMLATDGHRLVGTAVGESLSVLSTADAVVVASEPHDDHTAWQSVPDRSLVEAVPGSVTCTPLHGKGSR